MSSPKLPNNKLIQVKAKREHSGMESAAKAAKDLSGLAADPQEVAEENKAAPRKAFAVPFSMSVGDFRAAIVAAVAPEEEAPSQAHDTDAAQLRTLNCLLGA